MSKLTAQERDEYNRHGAEDLQADMDKLMAKANALRERGLSVSMRLVNEPHEKRAILSVRQDFRRVSRRIYVTIPKALSQSNVDKSDE